MSNKKYVYLTLSTTLIFKMFNSPRVRRLTFYCKMSVATIPIHNNLYLYYTPQIHLKYLHKCMYTMYKIQSKKYIETIYVSQDVSGKSPNVLQIQFFFEITIRRSKKKKNINK